MIQEPTPLQPSPTEFQPGPSTSGSGSARPRFGRGRLRAAVVLVACLALAVPVVFAMAAPSAPRPNSVGAAAAVSASAPAAADPDELKDPANGHDKGPKADKGLKGLKGLNGGHGPGKGHITITAIDGSDLSLRTDDGWTRTITVTPDTIITKGGQTITVAGLAVGDEIRFRQVRNADGSFTVTAIVVPTPTAGGEVTAVGETSITVKRKDGSAQVIAVTPSTVYTLGPIAGSKSDVKVSSEIRAEGTISGTDFTATAVHVKLPHAGGVVTGKTSDSITVRRPDGTTTVIHVSSSTKYRIRGKEDATLADVEVGDRIQAEGTVRPDGSLDALAVHGGGPKGGHGPWRDAPPNAG